MSAQTSIFSQEWYRLASLKPSLRPGVRISRQTHRGEVWYVLLDPVNGSHQRVNRLAYELVGRLDGHNTCEDIWQTLLRRLGNKAPSQDEVIRTMSQLYESNMLSLSTRGDFEQLKAQGQKLQRQQAIAGVNPLSFRVAVWQPGPWLDRMQSLARALFSTPGMLVWCLLVLAALLTLAIQWKSFSNDLNGLWSHPQSLLLSWLVYPVLKFIHEMAHALAVRRYGGDVGEFGVRMLTLLPVPYVDASSANLFAFKHQRAVVAGAGIAAEVGLAALAILLWASMGPGMPRQIALFVVLIGGLSTLAFNANPLLKFDGYYLLTDLLELPNLAQRSQTFWKQWFKRILFGVDPGQHNTLARGEAPWLSVYGALSFIYRWVLGLGLVILAADLHWTVGLIMLGGSLFMLVIKPSHTLLSYLAHDPSLGVRRARAIAVCAALAVALVFGLLMLRLPATTAAQGVVWAPEKTQVRAQSPGFVESLQVRDGDRVKTGTVIARLYNEELITDWNRLQAELTEARTERLAAMGNDALQMRTIEDRIGRIEAELALLARRIEALEVRAESDGVLVIPRVNDLLGRHVRKGEQFAQILTGDPTVIRVAVVNHEASRVRTQTDQVEVMWPGRAGETTQARLLGEVPATVNTLPSAALGEKGGGRIQIDPQGGDGTRTSEPVFLFDVQTPFNPGAYPGMRIWVRFDHGSEPVLTLLHREWRRLFLRHFEK